MLDVDARVDDIGAGSRTGGLVVDVRGLVLGTVRNARQAPGDVLLGDVVVDGEDSVLLNVFDVGKVLDCLERLAAQVGREALELGVAVDMLGVHGGEAVDGVLDFARRGAVLELDDIAAGNHLGGSARLDDRGGQGQG